MLQWLKQNEQWNLNYQILLEIRGLQDAKEGEDPKPVQPLLCSMPAWGAPQLSAISEVQMPSPSLTKQHGLPTAEPQVAHSSRLWRGGDSFLLHSSQARGSDGRSAARSAGTAGSAWLAWVAAKHNQKKKKPTGYSSWLSHSCLVEENIMQICLSPQYCP